MQAVLADIEHIGSRLRRSDFSDDELPGLYKHSTIIRALNYVERDKRLDQHIDDVVMKLEDSSLFDEYDKALIIHTLRRHACEEEFRPVAQKRANNANRMQT